MTGSVIGALRVTLGIDTAAWESGLSEAQRSLNAAGQRLQAIGNRMSGIGKGMSLAITAPLAAFGVQAVRAATESAQAIGQVNAALASMGPVAGRTSEQLQRAATELMHISTFDDDEILRSVTANMLTFGNVAGEAFDRAQLAAVNLSARLGTDLQASTLLVGKALNDPVKGMAALRRVGIQLTEQQQDQVRAFVAAGDAAGAQGIILGELERQFGGAAQAMRDATPGMDLKNAWDDFSETVGGIVARVLPPLTAMLSRVLESFNSLSPGTQSFIVGAAAVAAAVGPVLVVLGTLVSSIGSLLPVFAPLVALIGEAGLAGVFGALGAVIAPALPVIAAVAAAGALIYANWDKIAPVLQRLWSQIQATLGPALGSLITTVKTVLTDLWNGPFGEAIRVVMGILGEFAAAYGEILGTTLIRILTALVTAVEGAFKLIGDALRFVAALLSGDFRGAWDAAKSFVADAINGILAVIRALAPGAIEAVQRLVQGVRDWIVDRLGAIWDSVKAKIDWIKDAFFGLYDAVVGHSYIPDLFDGIARNAARFLPEFVTPVLAGIGQVSDAFRGLGETDVRLPSIVVTAPSGGTGDGGTDGGDGTSPTGNDAQNDLKEAFRQTFTDGIKAALKGDLSGFFQKWFEGIGTRALDNIVGKLTDLLFDAIGNAFGGTGNGEGGLFVSIFSAIFGRASGGPVLANHPYIVGEKRAEVFVPSTAGRIEPDLSSLGRGHRAEADGPSSLNFNFYGPVTNPQEVRRSAAQAGAQLIRMMGEGKRGV